MPESTSDERLHGIENEVDITALPVLFLEDSPVRIGHCLGEVVEVELYDFIPLLIVPGTHVEAGDFEVAHGARLRLAWKLWSSR